MKKLTVAAILSSALFLSGNVYAENATLTNESIQGAWTLEYTKQNEKSNIVIEREDTWVFKKDGTVIIKHIPREGGYYDQSPVKYEIEGGKLKIAILGRMGKFDKFSLVSIEEKVMTLKAKFGNIYRFIKK